jgi:hypothetical protein
MFATERGGPFTPDAINQLVKRSGARARFAFPVHAHMLRHACGYALANADHDALHAIERGAVQGLLEMMTGGLLERPERYVEPSRFDTMPLCIATARKASASRK